MSNLSFLFLCFKLHDYAQCFISRTTFFISQFNITQHVPLQIAQHLRRQFYRPTRNSEPIIIPVHVQREYLTPDQLRKLHFKPTVGSIQLSEGHEAKFNCSIDIPDPRLEPTIAWVKNGQDLPPKTQVVINELQTMDDSNDGVLTLLSTIRYGTCKFTYAHILQADYTE